MAKTLGAIISLSSEQKTSQSTEIGVNDSDKQSQQLEVTLRQKRSVSTSSRSFFGCLRHVDKPDAEKKQVHLSQ